MWVIGQQGKRVSQRWGRARAVCTGDTLPTVRCQGLEPMVSCLVQQPYHTKHQSRRL